MNSKGIFGTIVLLLAIEAILLIQGAENEIFSRQSETATKISSIQKTNFERTQAEIYLDKTITKSMRESVIFQIDAEQTKAKVNNGILKALQKLGFNEKGICEKDAFGKEKIVKELNSQNLNEITNVIAVKQGELTAVNFSVTGGLKPELFPCAKIQEGHSVSFFRVPIGYSETIMVMG